MAYFDTKKDSLEEAIKAAVKNEKLDTVNKTAVKKKFDDRKDKDIDNDGDVDSSDEYLHKRRKAISKAIKSEENDILHDGIMDKQTKSRLAYSISKLPPHLAKLFDKDGNLKRDAADRIAKGREKFNILDEASQVLAHGGNGQYKAVAKGDKIHIMYKGKQIAGGEQMDGVLFIQWNGGKSKETFKDAQTMVDYFAKKKVTESFEYGSPEATENSLNMTPGQSTQEWDEQVGLMHKKQNTMREAIAKMWGVDEGHNPFKKEEVKTSKKEGKTMTGKSETKVTIGMKDK